MRFLSRTSLFLAFASCVFYFTASLPLVNQDAAHFGPGYFWAWLLVTLPITLRFWVLPFDFGHKAFKKIYVAQFVAPEGLDDEGPANGRRIGAVFIMLAAFITSCQVVLHFVLGPMMNDFLDKASRGDSWGAAIMAVILYIVQQLTFTFIFPFIMAPFMVAAKSLANNATRAIAYDFRGYITGAYPFMNWVFSERPE